jgi:hypothetical protein
MNGGPPSIQPTENSDALKLQNNTVSITSYAEIHSQKCWNSSIKTEFRKVLKFSQVHKLQQLKS